MSTKIQIYQVLPRLFGNTKKNNKFNGTIDENGCGKMAAFSTKGLKAIKKMGFTHLWYTGIIEHATQTNYEGIAKDHPSVVKGKAGSPYAIKDYYDVDPDLAKRPKERMKEFGYLVNRTHRAGMKMIIDFVPNHVARQYQSDNAPEGVTDLGAEDDTTQAFSPQNNFYYIPNESFKGQFDLKGEADVSYEELPAKATGNDRFDACPTSNDWYETIKLNYGVDYSRWRNRHFHPRPSTWNKMLEILLFWAKKKVDGFRCDMAEMVPVEFWGWVIPQVKALYPNVIFIAEIYNPNEYRNYIFNGKFDYLYDKEGLYNILRSVTNDYTPATMISQAWQMTDGIGDQMLSFTENHDEQRVASDFYAGEARKGFPGILIAATFNRGPSMIYFGQELGERGMEQEGFSGVDGRTTIFDYWTVPSISQWINKGKFNSQNLSLAQQKIKAFYTRLFSITKEEKAISDGLFFDLMYVNADNPSMNGKQYAFVRKYEDEVLFIIANFSESYLQVQLKLPLHLFECFEMPISQMCQAKELLSEEESSLLVAASSPLSIEMDRWSGKIIKINLKETIKTN